ncbi:phage tail tube protein [Shinella yambaruensis]|uniref:phage tail tube protein n=1 Tax=Shinella yambaruensis TaxID=415996 RepID=UPI003D795F33
MTVADGSQVRLADVTEATPGTIPATPTFQVMRYVDSDLRVAKQTDVPNEVTPDLNVRSIVDVGRSVAGSINTLLSFGTFDTWLARLFRSEWSSDVLKNSVLDKTGTLENTFKHGATSSFLRYYGVRWNTLDLTLRARQSVQANWGVMGIGSPTPTSAIISGATYTNPTETPVFNAALNVGALALGGVTASPKMQALTMRINGNVRQDDVLGQYEPYGHGLGRFEVTGTMTTYFENLYAYQAILDHDDVGLTVPLTDELGNSYTIAMPKMKLLDGGPRGTGNGNAVIMDVPFQAYYDATSAATMSITRAVAP